MANQYFKFKQFTIHQDRCAMKVCTDACLFGSWVASQLERNSENFNQQQRKIILDIGSGTGLLIMMLAQKIDANIYGIEIEPLCFEQLKENTSQNQWNERIQLYNDDIRNFQSEQPFDFIISNPPFFENDLNSSTSGEQLAKHSKELSLEELLGSIDRNLSTDGSFSVLLPYHRVDYFENMGIQKGFYPVRKMLVKQSEKHGFFRGMLTFSRTYRQCINEELSIRINNEYSPQFIELLKDYYLYL
ncbi:MAG: tRNA1(Val) (adenine(37)-N6)-methyltransferase [Flavitalea sp.]